MSGLEFKPTHTFFRVTISSIKYAKSTNPDVISLYVSNNSPYKVTLPLGLLGYCETNATFYPTQEQAFRVKNILKLLAICQSTILIEKLSIKLITNDSKRNTDNFTKTLYFKPTFQISKIQTNNKILTILKLFSRKLINYQNYY